ADAAPVHEHPREPLAAKRREMALPGHDRSVKGPARASGQRDQSLGLALEPGEPQMRRLVWCRFEKCAGVKAHEAAVAVLARGQENDPRAFELRGAAGARKDVLVG